MRKLVLLVGAFFVVCAFCEQPSGAWKEFVRYNSAGGGGEESVAVDTRHFNSQFSLFDFSPYEKSLLERFY